MKFEQINTNKFNKVTLKYIDYRDYQDKELALIKINPPFFKDLKSCNNEIEMAMNELYYL